MRQDEYVTKNLNLSSYLYASGIKFVGVTKVNGEFFFRFVPKKEAENLISNYFADTARVSPRELFSRLKDLKDLIFSGGYQ